MIPAHGCCWRAETLREELKDRENRSEKAPPRGMGSVGSDLDTPGAGRSSDGETGACGCCSLLDRTVRTLPWPRGTAGLSRGQPAPRHESISSLKKPTPTFIGVLNNCFLFLGEILLPRLKMKDHGCRVVPSPLSPLGSIWKRLVLHLFDIQVNSFPSSQSRLPVLAIWKAGLEINRQTLGRGSRNKTQNRFEKRLF